MTDFSETFILSKGVQWGELDSYMPVQALRSTVYQYSPVHPPFRPNNTSFNLHLQ